jgi:hypothetical protein
VGRRRPLTADERNKTQVSPYAIGVGKSGTGISFSISNSALSCQHYPTMVPCTFFPLAPSLHSLSSWLRRSITQSQNMNGNSDTMKTVEINRWLNNVLCSCNNFFLRKAMTINRFLVYVCNLIYPACKRYKPFYVISCNNIFPHYLKNSTISGIKLSSRKSVLWFSLQICQTYSISHSKNNSARCYHACFRIKYPLLLSEFI